MDLMFRSGRIVFDLFVIIVIVIIVCYMRAL